MVDNPRAKGNRIERKAEDKLHNEGFSTARMPHTRYGDNDFFNLFDIIAVKPGAPFKCVQVKANSWPNLTQFKEDALEKMPRQNCQILLYRWTDYKGWTIRLLNREKEEWETILDET